jgi:ferrous iron transport protein B
LNGKSFVPLLSSFACAIPGILATRTISDPKARCITILIAPLMSCSARLPVYLLLIGAFVEPEYGAAVAGFTLFAMHFIGVLLAGPLAWLLHRSLPRSVASQPFVMELPHYRVPQLGRIGHRLFESGSEFIVRAGTVICAMTIIIWALLYFPRPPELAESIQAAAQVEKPGLSEAEQEDRLNAAYLEQSYMGRFGRAVQPVFAPAGYDWKITVGVLASFPAREIIISTLGITYALGGEVDEGSDDLRSTLAKARWESGPRAGSPVFNLPVALSIMVFFAICMQCGATVAVIAKELHWGWALGSFFGLTTLAWIAAVLTYQIGMWLA